MQQQTVVKVSTKTKVVVALIFLGIITLAAVTVILKGGANGKSGSVSGTFEKGKEPVFKIDDTPIVQPSGGNDQTQVPGADQNSNSNSNSNSNTNTSTGPADVNK